MLQHGLHVGTGYDIWITHVDMLQHGLHVGTGYDMDYTLIQYDVNAWEQRAYEYGLQFLRADGVPVEGLRFDPTLVIRGLIVDKERGNLLKVDRFGCANLSQKCVSY
jgi:hypothetical protein